MTFLLLLWQRRLIKYRVASGTKHESMIKKKLDFDMKDQFVVFSSETRHGYDQVWDAILKNI